MDLVTSQPIPWPPPTMRIRCGSLIVESNRGLVDTRQWQMWMRHIETKNAPLCARVRFHRRESNWPRISQSIYPQFATPSHAIYGALYLLVDAFLKKVKRCMHDKVPIFA